jgi:hypothetical protein
MKKSLMFSAFVVCFLFVSVHVNATGYRTGFSDYEIEEVENLNLDKSVEKVWTLTYNGGENPVTVLKRNTPDGAVYVVNSKFFEVCYASTSKGFGTRTLKKSWSTVPPQLNDVVINPEEISNQQIISPNKIDDGQALGLIASYLPGLLNDQYTHLLN